MEEDQSKKQEKTIKQLMAELKHKDYEVRQSAAKALGEKGEQGTVILALIEALNDEEHEVGYEAKKALIAIGSPAIPALNKALLDNNSKVRYEAASALQTLGSESIVTLPNLLQSALLFSDNDYYDDYEEKEMDQEAAVAAWDAITAHGPKAIPVMLEYAENTNEETVDEIIEMISSYSMYKYKDTIPTLIVALKGENQFIRELASTILDKMRNHSSVIPSLIEAFGDVDIDEEVRWLIRLTLESIYPLTVQTKAVLNEHPINADEKLERLTKTAENSETAAVREKAIWQLEDLKS